MPLWPPDRSAKKCHEAKCGAMERRTFGDTFRQPLCEFTEQENQSHVLIAFGPSHMAWNRTLKAFKQESKYQNWYDLV